MYIRYEIREELLFVRAGFLCWKIRLDEIKKVFPTTSLWASPTLSTDRIAIQYERNGVLKSIIVSPIPREEFLSNLSLLNNEEK